jgi:hypothetical protein
MSSANSSSQGPFGSAGERRIGTENSPTWRPNDRRTTSSCEGIRVSWDHCYSPTPWSSPRRRPQIDRTGRHAGRHACRISRPRWLVARRRRRPRDAVAHARAPPTPMRVRRRRRGGDRGFTPLLPPQQAAWIPAGLAHQTTLRACGRAFFEPAMVPSEATVRVLAAVPPIRDDRPRCAGASTGRRAIQPPTPFSRRSRSWPPTGSIRERLRRLPPAPPDDQAIMAHTQAHLADVTPGRAPPPDSRALTAPAVPGGDRNELAAISRDQSPLRRWRSSRRAIAPSSTSPSRSLRQSERIQPRFCARR